MGVDDTMTFILWMKYFLVGNDSDLEENNNSPGGPQKSTPNLNYYGSPPHSFWNSKIVVPM